MTTLVYASTKWALDLVTRLIRARVRVHNAEALAPDMAAILTVNHFTRIETILLPHAIIRHTGRQPRALAAGPLFTGALGAYLRGMGAVSTRDPQRDTLVVGSLLEGKHPWIVFPEGHMVKDKKVVDASGAFVLNSVHPPRPPHRGAAVLALRAEFYRRKLARLDRGPEMNALLERFGLDSPEQTAGKRTVIVPVNITYYPLRARDNMLLRLAQRLNKDLGENLIEELSVEGTILSEDTDIDISFGAPIEVSPYLSTPGIQALIERPGEAPEDEDAAFRREIGDASTQIMIRYMTAIYAMTVVNCNHVLAGLIRAFPEGPFTETMLRRRFFLAVAGLRARGDVRLHPRLVAQHRDAIAGDAFPELDEFLRLALEEGALRREGPYYTKVSIGGDHEYRSIRRQHPMAVIANEIEPVHGAAAAVVEAVKPAGPDATRAARQFVLDEDRGLFELDAEAYGMAEGMTPETSRPLLLVPRCVKAGVALAHGYLATPEQLRALAEFLCRCGCAVYGIRLRGHGTAPEDLAQWNWTEWRESCNRGVAVLRTYTERVVLGGFSFGGTLALLTAARKVPPVAGVFTINAPLRIEHLSGPLAPAPAMGILRRPRRSDVREGSSSPFPIYHRNPVGAQRQLGNALAAAEAVLNDVKTPVQLIQGANDPVVKPENASLIFERLGTPFKALTLLARDRHDIVNASGSAEVFEYVRFFVLKAAEDGFCRDGLNGRYGRDGR